ncbi:DHA2 family efflux MFS transporter permease subunit [Streptomyces sp. NPDC048331]|uniref:DHA2 family efflux MFS transporter permease subunit n=1 Tax=Streptomyces sp. NPDC048331 TaxID=3365534 RepID=UPI0037213FF8
MPSTRPTTDPTAAPAPARRRWLALAAPVFGLMIVGLDATILTVALPTLSNELSATTTELQWFTDGYTLPFAGLLLPFGALGDRIGRRKVLIGGLLLFGLGSLMVMGVDSSEGLIIARVIMGAGAAAITPLALAIVPLMFPAAERAKAMAITTAGFALGVPLGPLAGGWLLDNYWWGSIFLINVPVVVLAITGIVLFVPETRAANAKRLDLIGAALSIAGVTAFVYAVIEVPNSGWSDPAVLLPGIGGIILLVALVIWLRKTASPLVDLGFFRNKRFTWASITVSHVMFILFGVLFVVPQFFQQVQGKDAFSTGLHLLPLILALVVAARLGGRIAERSGPKAVITVGMIMWTIGLLVLAGVDADTDFTVTGSALALMGAALGFTMPTTLDMILSSLPEEHVGAGSALANSMRQIGASIGVAILGSTLNALYQSGVDPDVPAQLPAEAQDAIRDNVAAAAKAAEKLPAPQGGTLLESAQDAFVSGMSAVAFICAGLAALTTILVITFLPTREKNTAPLKTVEAPTTA